MPVIPPGELQAVIAGALANNRTKEEIAACVASALVLAEIDGRRGHGLSRVPSYVAQLKSNKVKGRVNPRLKRVRPGVLKVDARNGFAYPALEAVHSALPGIARENGIAMAAIHNSHHYGVAGHHVERMAEMEFVALLFGNTPAAIAPWGGRTRMFGTNPIAFAAPVAYRAPLVVDLATSKVARGPILAASQRGEAIPEGWALDAAGEPTTDAAAALEGSMLPMADAKGAALALMIEVIAAALTGAAFGHEASSYFDTEGGPPGTGQVMIAIDPKVAAKDLMVRLSRLASLIEKDGGRMPGSSAAERRRAAERAGIEVDAGALAAAEALAGTGAE